MTRSNLFGAIAGVIVLVAIGFLLLSPEGGGKAPDVSLKTLSGEQLQLSQFEGQPVLVSFWATTCPGCIAEMPHLVDLHKELAPKGLRIIGVAMDYDPLDQVQELVKRKQLPYTIVHDSDSSISNAFGKVRLTPTNFLIAPDGTIVMQKLGDLDIDRLHQQIETMLGGRA